MANRVNFTERQEAGGWAKFLPAISGFYTTHLGKDLSVETFVPVERLPKGFEFGLQGLNFFDPDYSYFNYKYGLFSAGHAERKLDRCDDREPMIHRRQRDKTILVGDSGGFQVAKGVIKLDWATVKGPEGDKLREEILRYLEHTSDWSMTLDVPAFAATEPFSAKTGLTKFEDTLDVSIHNLHYFIKNRVIGATKFLNVLSGSDSDTSKKWYEGVKAFSDKHKVEHDLGYDPARTFEGYAFAGVNMRNMQCTLERLLNLRDEGLLEGKDWIHFLGVGRLDWACYLTSIERQLKKHINPNVNISFDAASPFVAAGGYALSYTYNHHTTNRLTYSMDKGLDDKRLKGSKMAMPFGGPIMERITAGDICVMGPDDENKHGKIGKTSWDTTSYAIIMAHNVHNHLEAVQEVNRLADMEYARMKPVVKKITPLGECSLFDHDAIDEAEWERFDYRNWYMYLNKNTKLSEYIPNSILLFNDFAEKLFDPETEDPYKMLKDYTLFLKDISFGRDADNSMNLETMDPPEMYPDYDKDAASEK